MKLKTMLVAAVVAVLVGAYFAASASAAETTASGKKQIEVLTLTSATVIDGADDEGSQVRFNSFTAQGDGSITATKTYDRIKYRTKATYDATCGGFGSWPYATIYVGGVEMFSDYVTSTYFSTYVRTFAARSAGTFSLSVRRDDFCTGAYIYGDWTQLFKA